jgi:ectoine hydroxylase-related dioxygenase (phytanoyl-CoA dioxygenase family)
MIEADIGVFNSSGFFVRPRFLDRSRCDELMAESRRLLDSDVARHYPRSSRVWELYRYGETFVDVMCNQCLYEVVTRLLGKGALISDFSLNEVRKGGLPDKWHIDYPYNEMPTLVRGSLLGLQCILALSPFDVSSGATQLVPGTHLQWRHPDDSASTSAVTFLAEPGDMLVMASATWHRAGVNTQERPRTAMLFSFVESWIRPMTGPPEQGPWSSSAMSRLLLGIDRLPEEMPLDGVAV